MVELKSVNPADGYSLNGTVTCSSAQQIRAVVSHAADAVPLWGGFDAGRRAEMLKPIVKLLERNAQQLAKLITAEMGKPLAESRAELLDSIEESMYFLTSGPGFLCEEIFSQDDKQKNILRREPWGAAAVLGPWNYPLEIALWGILPNLICGNTVVYKPSETTPLLGAALDGLFRELDLPKGVFTTIHGTGVQGSMLVDNPEIRLIWMTGSTKTGEIILKNARSRFIKTVMELGGSSAGILFDDVEPDDTLISELLSKRFTNCGQVCSAIKRLYVPKKKYRQIVGLLTEKTRALKIGNPLNAQTQISSLSSKKQLLTIERQLTDALKKGAKAECGGKRPKEQNGAYFCPTILTNVTADMSVMNEEVFGPILPVVPYRSEEQAIRMANATQYGLSANIFCNDRERAMEVAKRLEAGRIVINGCKVPGVSCPFGGYKKSGVGREHGRWGFYELTQLKYIAAEK